MHNYTYMYIYTHVSTLIHIYNYRIIESFRLKKDP